MKILVTGGNGFLGTWLVKRLVKEGHDVSVLHRKTSDLSALDGIKFQSALGDITNSESLTVATQGVDAIFHVAGFIAYSPHEYEKMVHINVRGTSNVIQAALKNRVERFVHTSSVVAVGASQSASSPLLSESSPYKMGAYRFGYYDSKFAAEEVVRKAVKEQGLDGVIVNPGIMFGPGDFAKDTRRFHLKVAQGKVLFYPSGGVNILDVEDAVEGHLLALKMGKAGERYILGGENILIKEMFAMLAKAAGGRRAPSIQVPGFLLRSIGSLLKKDSLTASTLFHWYDTSKAKQELGFNPKPAYQAIERSIKWCIDQKILT